MPDRIDAWTHIFPKAYFAKLQTMASAAGPLKRWLQLKSLYDLDHRFRLMDGFAGYRQLLRPRCRRSRIWPMVKPRST